MHTVSRWTWMVLPLALVGALLVTACGEKSAPLLIEKGQSDGRIVLVVDDEPTYHAAAELQRYLSESTGAMLPIVPPNESFIGPAIHVGWGEEATAVAPDLEPDAFVWHSPDPQRLLIGGPGGGTLYGVYAFLEEHVGIRRYTPEATHVPAHERFALPQLAETRRPAFPIRWVHMPAAEDQAWCDWHGAHSRAHRETSWGMFVHTFEKLVRPEDHFGEHPEYFSELKGRRVPNMQLCLTNDDVFKLVVEGLRTRMAERPDAKLWSVSQNDRHGACACTNCKALADEHGSEAGPLITFVNRVAAEFPDKTISTLAYTYTRKAPRDLKPAPNVNICLCSIECDRAEPLKPSKRNADFVRDIEEWSALTSNLMIWDYVVQFSNYVSPFPNFHVLQPNIQLFRDHDVQLMFQQGSGGSRSDLSELKQYVIAKLLWDPDRDVDALIDDFLAGYYGEAADHVRRYLDLLHDRLQETGAPLSIYGSPVVEGETWLTPQTLDEAEAILDAAEEAVAKKLEVRRRIQEIRLSSMYARLEQAKRLGIGEYGLFQATPNGGWQVKARWPKLLDQFITGCRDGGFKNVHERKSPPDEYRAATTRFFDDGMVTHLAIEKPIDLSVPFNPKWPANGLATLHDGIKGTTDYRYNWIGWEAVDMTATVDLGEVRDVSNLAADFLQVVGSWIWQPVEVRWSTSADGKSWEPAGTLKPKESPKRDDFFTERYECSFHTRQVRYVRLEADSVKHCPDWHQGAGGDAWIFCDEVMVFE